MDFLLEITKIGKSLETFGSRIDFLRFLKSIGWYGFPYGFLVVLNLFHKFYCLKLLLVNMTNAILSKTTRYSYLWKHICIIGWCLVRQRNP